jgi:putative membrane protein
LNTEKEVKFMTSGNTANKTREKSVPDDPKAGRAPIIYIIAFTVASLLSLIAMMVYADTQALFKGGKGILEFGIYALLTGLSVFTIWHGSIAKGTMRSVAGFAIVAAVAFFYEVLGVNFGWVFGKYIYTELVDPNLFGVSLAVLPAWGPISYASYYLTNFLLPTEVEEANKLPVAKRVVPYLVLSLVGGVLTTMWDLMMDPVDVARGWYIWEGGGAYRPDGPNGGVPLTNYYGWIFTGFCACLIYRVIFDTASKVKHNLNLDVYGPILLYGACFTITFGMCAVFLDRASEVLLIGGMSMGAILLIAISKAYLLRNHEHSRTHAWIRDAAKTAD